MLHGVRARIEKGIKSRMPKGAFPEKADRQFWRAWWLATFYGVGLIRPAPGTMGSLAGLVVFVFIGALGALLSPSAMFFTLWAAVAFLFFLGARASGICIERLGKHDPTQIVIDEVVGMNITLLLTMAGLGFTEYYVLGEVKKTFQEHMGMLMVIMFFSFRIMDVIKPWPICWCDAKVKGGFGVMLDDVLAAVAAAALSLAVYGALISTVWKPL